MEEKQILNVTEAADYLGLSTYTTREYARGNYPGQEGRQGVEILSG